MANRFITIREFEKESGRILDANMLPVLESGHKTALGKILSKTYRTDELLVKDFQLDKKFDNLQKQDYFNVIP